MTSGSNYSTLGNLLYIPSVLVFNGWFIVALAVVFALSSAAHTQKGVRNESKQVSFCDLRIVCRLYGNSFLNAFNVF